MTRIVVLMYHALYASASELDAIDAADRPYAVSLESFRQQLDRLARAQIPVVDPTTPPTTGKGVIFSFDDGHVSNHRLAFPSLRERNWPGLFFVTTDFVGRRPGFCSWEQLREMGKSGMHIGSHCRTHRFLDDLPDAEVKAEFQDSRRAIENGTGRPTTWVSFPGGRYRQEHLALGRAAGFELFFSSEVGLNDAQAFESGAVVRRVAVRATTSLERFADIASGSRAHFFRAQAVARVKRKVRGVLGNRMYQALYEGWGRVRTRP